MHLPLEFISNIEGVFGTAGKQFLADLPALIEEAAKRWGLTDVQPSPELSYNFVAFANRGEEQVVLKMSVPNREARSEMAALRLFNGQGACRLIDYDAKKCWMLLERLQPGVMLATLEEDEEATHIAADVMQRIWRPVEHVIPPQEQRGGVSEAKDLGENGERLFGRTPALADGARDERSLRVTYNQFIQLTDWFDGLKKIRPYFKGGTGPFHPVLLERAERSAKDFLIENHRPVLMHGDFHHFNVLSSERGWLIIDPKGVIGPACYEVGPFLMNPWDDLLRMKNYQPMIRRRIDILHERLGFERERIWEWGLAHAVLSAWWSIEDHTGEEYALAFAEMIAELDIK